MLYYVLQLLHICLLVSPQGTAVTPEDIFITFNSSVNITCNAGGGPNNVYQWRKQEELVSNNTQLNFQSVTGSDGGVYQCTVMNAAGYGTASTHLYGTYVRTYVYMLHVCTYVCIVCTYCTCYVH